MRTKKKSRDGVMTKKRSSDFLGKKTNLPQDNPGSATELPFEMYMSVCAYLCVYSSEYVTSNGWFRPGEVYQLSMHKNTFTPSADVPPQVSLHTLVGHTWHVVKICISLGSSDS